MIMGGRFSGANFLALSLVGLLVIAAATHQVRSSSEVALDDVCNDKPVSLTKISTTRQLIEENRLAHKESCSKYSDSLEELDDILATAQSGKICDLDFVDKIRKYHQNFIASPDNKARENIPKSLRHFFISLCFQISAECKMALINNLEYDTKDKLTDADYEEIKFLENYGATLLDSDTEITDFDDILLINDLNEAAGLTDETGESKLLVKVKTNNLMRKLVENCKTKFKPFYDKLIMPLIKLSNLGYNYQGELLEREMAELRRNNLVRRWYNIVQMCETFRTIQIYEDPEAGELSSNRQVLTFISGDEAASLRQRNVKTVDEEIADDEAARGEASTGIVYDPIASHNLDELWIQDQKELEKLVHKYKASSTEADRVRSKLFKKLVAKIKETLMSGKVVMLASELIKTKFDDSGRRATSVNDEMIMMMDEAVEQEELDKGDQQAEVLEAAVAGLKGKVARKVVSRVGPVSHVKNMGIPDRPRNVIFKKDGTKGTTKLFNFGHKFLPSRMSIFMFIVGTVGLCLILIGVFAAVSG